MHALSEIATRHQRLQKGKTLYRQGDAFKSLYAIRGGSVKTYGLTEDGEAQITGFHLTGEIVGMDAIGGVVHPCTAELLEDSWVCELPFNKLEELSRQLPSLQRELLHAMAQEIRNEEHALMLVRGLRAEQRVMRFINSLLKRMQERLGNIVEIPLAMTREDIANYLGLAPETLSRALAKLRDDGVIRVELKSIEVLDQEAVRRIASC
ncbi:MAG: fumarate/nitrate reduction transcriptional regulator Fnr [Gammaproteobacteria bacterium]